MQPPIDSARLFGRRQESARLKLFEVRIAGGVVPPYASAIPTGDTPRVVEAVHNHVLTWPCGRYCEAPTGNVWEHRTESDTSGTL